MTTTTPRPRPRTVLAPLTLPLGVALMLAFSAPAHAAEGAAPAPADERGFSYFMGVGRHSVSYKESPVTLSVRSQAKASSPLLTTGALYVLGTETLLSLDSETTFAPGTTTETWHTSLPMGTVVPSDRGPVAITSPLLQTNRFSLYQTTGRLLLQHRLRKQLFAFGGAAFHTHSFKRFGFTAGPDNVVNVPVGTIEETVSETLLNLGLALESERVRGSQDHYTLRVGLGVPVWRRVQNTDFPNNSFDGTGGYDVSVSGRYSYALRPNVHVGGWGQVTQGERRRQTQGAAELPKSEMRSLSYGIELLWKL